MDFNTNETGKRKMISEHPWCSREHPCCSHVNVSNKLENYFKRYNIFITQKRAQAPLRY